MKVVFESGTRERSSGRGDFAIDMVVKLWYNTKVVFLFNDTMKLFLEHAFCLHRIRTGQYKFGTLCWNRRSASHDNEREGILWKRILDYWEAITTTSSVTDIGKETQRPAQREARSISRMGVGSLIFPSLRCILFPLFTVPKGIRNEFLGAFRT